MRRRACANSRLIGQNVNAYHGEGPDGTIWTLSRLLYRLAEIPGIARLRYTTSHPRDMDDALILTHGDLPALMPSLHLPVQSGSDRVLEAMNRKHTADHYRRIIARIRERQPGLALSSDFIVGFPGETDADFDDTMRLVADIGFAFSFSFKYSPRPGTPASGAGRSGAGGGEGRAAGAAAKAVGNAKGGLQSPDSRAELSTFSSRSRGGFPVRWPASRLTCSRSSSTPTSCGVGEIATVRIVRAGGGSLFGELIKAGDQVAA